MSKKWIKAALIRAIKTVAETAGAMLVTATKLEDVGWLEVLSTSILSGLLSMLTSIGGLPEVKEENL